MHTRLYSLKPKVVEDSETFLALSDPVSNRDKKEEMRLVEQRDAIKSLYKDIFAYFNRAGTAVFNSDDSSEPPWHDVYALPRSTILVEQLNVTDICFRPYHFGITIVSSSMRELRQISKEINRVDSARLLKRVTLEELFDSLREAKRLSSD